MGHAVNPLEQLGKAVAEEQDRALEAVVRRARVQFEGSDARRKRGERLGPGTWALAAAAAIGALALMSSMRRADPITFELDASRPGVVNEWVQASPEQDVAMRFSDGTTVLLAHASQGRVDELTPRGARVRLQRGRAAVSVPPGKGAQWRFDTGPFAVFVTGTRFDVSWDDKRQLFELSMQDGSVEVKGPTIVGERVVVAGQTLRIPLAPEESESKHTPVAADIGAPERAAPRAPKSEPSARPSSHAPVPMAHPPAKTWRELAAEGKFKDALAAVGGDYDAICARGSSADLLALGDAARFAGDSARAQKAYLTVRERFAGSADGQGAAFALGRMAFQARDDTSAVRWFESYLREGDDAPLAREALGRLMEAHARRQDASAKLVAARYLRAYPDGPHARLARSLVDR
jgi:ferric-dicitrate binding protein FerR (iron transport regulator)